MEDDSVAIVINLFVHTVLFIVVCPYHHCILISLYF